MRPRIAGVTGSLRQTQAAVAGPPVDPVPGGAASDDSENGRPIAPGSPRYDARLVRRLDLTGSLAVFWVAPDDEPARFEAGQYFTLGVEVAGKLVQRPYSAASSPRRRDGAYEFYVRLVTGASSPGQRAAYRAAYVLNPERRRVVVFAIGPHEGFYQMAGRRARSSLALQVMREDD